MAKRNRLLELLDAEPEARATISFYLAEAVVERVKNLAARRGTTASFAVEALLRSGLEEFERSTGDDLGQPPKRAKAVRRRRRSRP